MVGMAKSLPRKKSSEVEVAGPDSLIQPHVIIGLGLVHCITSVFGNLVVRTTGCHHLYRTLPSFLVNFDLRWIHSRYAIRPAY